MSVFQTLAGVNVGGKTEKKGNLTYLSWSHAWAEACKHYGVSRTVYETDAGCIYWTDGNTCWVKVGVTIEGVEHIDYLPIMDFKNRAIPVEAVTSTDVNKAIQRSTTKALALHGLGLNVYAGEDLPMMPALPTEAEVAKWKENGRTDDEIIQYAGGHLGCDITEEFIQMVKGL